ncbi:MAG TPA: GNAT family N-acetyltransferase [Spirochaetota bacterium]|nr:GNAT family N-acetyltransferase [Spirochaetota bacterium]HPJ36041.1 GNAT family N-acetyltransferase [Spirochaetota bacterium]
MHTDLTINNNLEPGDLGAIIKLHGDYYHRNCGFDYTFEAYVAKTMAEFALSKDENERIWIVKENEYVKGCIAIVREKDKTAQLRWFVLDSSIQGRGVGRKLIQEAIEFAGSKHYTKITLLTASVLQHAISIYKKNGFNWKKDIKHQVWGKELTEQIYEKIL